MKAIAEKILDAAIKARITLEEGSIADAKDTISHSIWVASIAVATLGASIALAKTSNSETVWYLAFVTIITCATSLYLGSKTSVTANNIISYRRNLINSASGELVEILASRIVVNDLELFSQQIYNSEISSEHFKKSRAKFEEKINKLREPEYYSNWQLYTLGLGIFFLILEAASGFFICS